MCIGTLLPKEMAISHAYRLRVQFTISRYAIGKMVAPVARLGSIGGDLILEFQRGLYASQTLTSGPLALGEGRSVFGVGVVPAMNEILLSRLSSDSASLSRENWLN